MMLNKDEIVLFLGNADTEGVTSKLKALGTIYKRKMLESSIVNWQKILDIFEIYDVSSVVVKLTNTSFKILCEKEYEELRDKLLELITSRPCLFLAHESLLTGLRNDEYEEPISRLNNYDSELTNEYENIRMYYENIFEPPPDHIRHKVISILTEFGISITPYRKNVELSLIVSSFIDKNENNLIFRIYVPSGRMWAGEAEKLLHLFRDYMHKVSGLNVRQDQYRTNQGVVYEFFGVDGIKPDILPQKFDEFSNFMESCVSNPDSAQALLESKNLNKSEIFDLVEKYSKEARRLHIDIKQERERKILAIKHSLESDLAEYVRTEHDWNIINRIVESSIPSALGVASAITVDRNLLPSANNHLTININPQIVDTINGVVAQHIVGDQHLGPDARQLLEIIEQYGGKNKAALASAVHELADKSAKTEDRVTAKQKLKGFLFAAGSKIGDVAVGLLQSYIEKQLGL